MKKASFFVFLLIWLFFLISCSDKEGNTTGPGEFPDISNENWIEEFDYTFSIWTDGIGKLDGIGINSKNVVNSCILKLNNIEVATYFTFDEESNCWHCETEGDYLPDGVDVLCGSNISYYLKINGDTFSDDIELPYEPIVNWSEFHIEEDFSFNWQIEKDPYIHVIDFNIYSDTTEFNEIFELSASKRTYTIFKEYFENFDESEINIWISLICINYKNFGNCFTMAVTYEDYNWSSKNKIKSQYKSIIQRKKWFELIKTLNKK